MLILYPCDVLLIIICYIILLYCIVVSYFIVYMLFHYLISYDMISLLVFPLYGFIYSVLLCLVFCVHKHISNIYIYMLHIFTSMAHNAITQLMGALISIICKSQLPLSISPVFRLAEPDRFPRSLDILLPPASVDRGRWRQKATPTLP